MSKGGIAALCLFYKNVQYDSNSKLVFPLLLVRGDFIKSTEFLPSTFDILRFCGSTVRFYILPSTFCGSTFDILRFSFSPVLRFAFLTDKLRIFCSCQLCSNIVSGPCCCIRHTVAFFFFCSARYCFRAIRFHNRCRPSNRLRGWKKCGWTRAAQRWKPGLFLLAILFRQDHDRW